MSLAPHTPLFDRGMGLSARFTLYVIAGLAILILDTRFSALTGVRVALNGVLHPLQSGLAKPVDWAHEMGAFFVTHGELKAENAQLQRERDRLRTDLRDRAALAAENTHLRGLLALPGYPASTPLAVEISHANADPFSRKVTINQGRAQGMAAGWPVVGANGLVGQVTRVYPWSSEVTLLTDRDQGAPVQSLRNGLRVIVSGTGSDSLLEVRFLDMHADLKVGDLLSTSGIDGVYPPGIPVAQVIRVEPPLHTPFARALCRPLGGVGEQRQLSVLKPSPAAPQAATKAHP